MSANDHRSRVQTYADDQGLAGWQAVHSIGSSQTLVQGGGRQYRPPGVVLVRYRRPKQRQENVLQEFLPGDHAVTMRQKIGQNIEHLRFDAALDTGVPEFITPGVEGIVCKLV